MKYVWSIAIGMIATFIGLSFYFESVPVSTYVLIALVLLAAVIGQIVYNKVKSAEITVFPIIFMVGTYIFAFVKCFEFIVIDDFTITSVVYFVMMLLFAIGLRNIEQNSWFGVRTFFTLEYKEIWIKTNRFYSVIISGSLPMLFALIFWLSGWVRFWVAEAIVLIPGFITLIYDSIIGSKYRKEAEAKEAEELKIQEEIELGYRRKN